MDAWTYFNETHHSDSLPDPYNTDNIFKVIGSKVKVTETFSGAGITIDDLLSKTIKFAFIKSMNYWKKVCRCKSTFYYVNVVYFTFIFRRQVFNRLKYLNGF